MSRVRTVHTADLSIAELAALREMLDLAFEGDFSDDDFEHVLGGVHVFVDDPEDATVLAHGAVTQRRMLHAGRAWRCGYVEGLCVRAGHRRRGLAGIVMDELERIVRGAYELGALSGTDEGLRFYAGRSWEPWRGTCSVLAPEGLRRCPEDEDSVMVLPVRDGLDLDGDLACDWRDGDVW